jgi:hypothetical protein
MIDDDDLNIPPMWFDNILVQRGILARGRAKQGCKYKGEKIRNVWCF